jgi:putative transposase
VRTWYASIPASPLPLLKLASISWVRFLEACFSFFPGVIVACMSDYRHKRHNVSSLLYHIVCPAKYRRVIFDPEVDLVLKEICLDIAQRYEIAFLEIGTDKDNVHFLVPSVPSYSPTKIVQIIKSFTAREIFHRVPTVKKRLWGGEFWSKGYFMSTVGRHGNEEVIRQYVHRIGKCIFRLS